MKETDIPFVQAECRIIYGVDEDGKQVISTTYTADGIDGAVPDYFTGLLMFEVGKINFLHRHGILQYSHEDD